MRSTPIHMIVLIGGLLAWSMPGAFAAEGHGPPGFHHGIPFAYEHGLLDAIGFDRSGLTDNGVDVHLSTMTVWQDVVDGGVEEDDELSNSYDLQLYFDSERMGWWDNGYAVIRAEGKTDDSGVNLITGAVIPVNFDAMVPEPKGKSFELTEYWYAHQFNEGKVEAVVGMWDIARFFDIVPASGPYHYRFMNAHMFFNSTLLEYAPYNILGGVVNINPNPGLTISTAVGDPNSSAVDVDWFEEGDYNLYHQWFFRMNPGDKPLWFSLGGTYKDQESATIDGSGTEDSDWSVYGNFNRWVYQDPDNPQKSVQVFGRVGVTNGEVNIIENHYSLGVSFDGMLSSRPKDVFGVVTWYNEFSGDLSSALDDSSAGFEAYYRFQVTPWLQVSPDVQFLIDPGITAGSDDTFVVGVRALIHW